MKIRPLFYLASALMILWSCRKEDEKPEAPVIEFVRISDTEVTEFNNRISITIAYEDYQGDIGESDPDVYSLRIKDARLSDYDWYHIPPLTPDQQSLHVKGEFTVLLNPVFLMGTGNSETTRFDIEVLDRAGNWSNTVTSPNVMVVDSL